MKDLLLIGIGPGDPRQVTVEAVEALRRASVFFVLDKGPGKGELVGMRKAILERYRPEGGYRLVQVADPQRDAEADDYPGAVHDWHRQRAALYARLISEEVGAEEIAAFCCGVSQGSTTVPCAYLTWFANVGWRCACR